MHCRITKVANPLLPWAVIVLLTGCASSPYVDTLNPDYRNFHVKRIGVVVWCAGYLSGDPSAASLASLDPSSAVLARADDWDKALSPCITSQVEERLKDLGYEAVDLSSQVTFGPQSRTGDVVADLRKRRPEIDAVLFARYSVSQFRASVVPLSGDPGGGVAVNNYYSQDYQSRHLSYYASGSSEGSYYTQSGGLNLRGSFKLVDIRTGNMLWEIGDRYIYIRYSAGTVQASVPAKDPIARDTCECFGRDFCLVSTKRQGIPAAVEAAH